MTGSRRPALGVLGLIAGALVLLAYVGGVVESLQAVADADDATPQSRAWTVAWVFLSPVPLLVLGLGCFLVYSGIRQLRGRTAPDAAPARTRRDAPGASESRGPVPVPPEEVELEEGTVAACMRCGSTRMAPLTLSDGMFAGGGETLSWVCRRCSWRGAPLYFDDPTAYRAFVRALHEEASDEDAAARQKEA